ncbi:MAG TPA: DUF58 domain-containing protein [Armatimonadota bacterium]|jgi:uncharacterized protein (DUF58 family)
MTRTIKRQILIWGAVFLLLVGLTLHIQQMLFMSGALALLAPGAYLLSRSLLRGLQVRRHAPSRLRAGEETTVSLLVSNPTVRARPAFWVEEDLPDGLAAAETSQLVLDLGPGEEREVSYTLLAERRGVYMLGPVQLTTSDAVGLHDFIRNVELADELLVYPRILSLADLWPRGPVERGVPRRRQHRPGGLDPQSTREYVPGDDLRHVAWKVSAHRDKMMIVEREHAQGLQATVLLDLTEGVHAGQGNETSLEYGVTLAASLLAQAQDTGATVALLADGDRDYSVAPDSAQDHRRRLLEALARCRTGGERPLAAVVRDHLGELPRGASVAVVTPQVGPEVLLVSDLLAGRGVRVIWFLLMAPSFERRASAGAEEERYHQLATTLGRRRQSVHLIRGDERLETALGRRLRATG